MSCIDENQVLQYVEGLFDEQEARAIEAHLAECAECRFLLATAGGAALDDSPSMAPTRSEHLGEDEPLAPGAADRKVGEVLQETYVVERFIGAGGMGAVYAVSHRRLARRFAVKFITAARVSDEEAVARMQREAYVTSRLSHPNIIQVTDFNYADDGAPYIVMELLEGESLAELLMREGALDDLSQVASIARQVTSALSAAHREGIVHRDLTPGNIFLCRVESGEPLVKVMDFGLSKIVERARNHDSRVASRRELTRVVSVLGSPHFMSPEQATGHSAAVDLRADVFSFGAILYRMLAGRPPFGGSDPQEVMRQVAFEEPAATAEWLRVAAPLREVVERALSKETPLRQASMTELWDELAAALQQATSAGTAEVVTFVDLEDDEEDQSWFGEDDKTTAHPGRSQQSSPAVVPPPMVARDFTGEDALDDLMPSPVRQPPRRRRAVAVLVVGLALASVLVGLVIALTPPLVEGDGRRLSLGAARGGQLDAASSRAPMDSGVPLDMVTVSLRTGDAGGPPAASGAAAARDGAVISDIAVARDGARAAVVQKPSRPRRPGRTSRPRRPARPRGQRRGQGSISVQTVSSDGRPLWADLYVDGRKAGQTALTVERISAGRHRLEVRRSGFRSVVRVVRVKAGRRLRVQLQMRRR